MFLDLPEDIQLAIYAYISPQDVLALKQTCRVLHAFGCMDYVWHQMKIDLPLDLPLDDDANLLSSSQLQPIVIRALRLERNWRQTVSHIRHLKRIPHGDIVYQMQMLRSKWLITLSRSFSTTHLSVWCLGEPKATAYRIASIEMHAALKFSSASQTEHDAIISVIGWDSSRREQLNVYTASLEEDAEPSSTVLRLCNSVSRPQGRGTFSDVHVCGHIVAATIARFSDMASPPSYEILFINTLTKFQWIIDPNLPKHTEQLRFKLYPDRMVLIGVRKHTALAVRVYTPLPSALTTSEKPPESIDDIAVLSSDLEAEEFSGLVGEYESLQFPYGFDFHLPVDSALKTPTYSSVIIFDSPFRQTGGAGYAFRFPLDFTRSDSRLPAKVPMERFATPDGTSTDIVCVGKTGRRAVWLQRRWDTDEFEIMKASFSSTGRPPVAEALLPKHLALPFEAHTCQSLTFDEATGRVCISLHTGELYILDL